jgi:NADPH:quinone reductase-like Zn-dependent oxidoreductase
MPGYRRLEYREFPVPVPGAGQALIRMRASAFCDSDVRVITVRARKGQDPKRTRWVPNGS